MTPESTTASKAAELLPCPFCGGPVVWCGENPAPEDSPHDCDQITCPHCEYNIDFNSDDVRVAETFESAKFIVAARWNRRPSSPQAQQADAVDARSYVGDGMFEGETWADAALHWAGWCDKRGMTGLPEFLRLISHKLAVLPAPYPGQRWKQGDEFLPFHWQASHVSPDYRDSWNACYRAMQANKAQGMGDARTCTCHPEDDPPKPCPRKFALNECRAAAGMGEPG
jgi:hypothetical protein